MEGKEALLPVLNTFLVVITSLVRVFVLPLRGGEDSKQRHTLFVVDVDPRRFPRMRRASSKLHSAALTAIQFAKSALSSHHHESSWILDWASRLEFPPFCHSFMHKDNKLKPATGMEGAAERPRRAWIQICCCCIGRNWSVLRCGDAKLKLHWEAVRLNWDVLSHI